MNDYKLQPVFDKENKTYRLVNFDDTKELLLQALSKASINLIVNDKDDLKIITDYRTEIRKQGKTLTDTRKQINDLLLGKLNTRLKELEKIISETDSKLKEKVDDFKERQKLAEQTKLEVAQEVFSVVISSLDKAEIDKVVEFAKTLNCKIVR